MMSGYGGYGMGWFSGIFMIVVWGLVIAGIVLLVRWLAASSQKHETGGAADSPLEILNIWLPIEMSYWTLSKMKMPRSS